MSDGKRLTILLLLFIVFVMSAVICTMTGGMVEVNRTIGIILLLGIGIALCVLLNDWIERGSLVIILMAVLTLAIFCFMIAGICFDSIALFSVSIALICLVIATFFTMLFYI